MDSANVYERDRSPIGRHMVAWGVNPRIKRPQTLKPRGRHMVAWDPGYVALRAWNLGGAGSWGLHPRLPYLALSGSKTTSAAARKSLPESASNPRGWQGAATQA